VFVLADVDGKLRAQFRLVRTGPTQGSEIAIDSGLEAGERVATDGSFKLSDGALVETDLQAADVGQPASN
jgi:membrane fusion protein (multidrug efflux system)